ncbi:TPA: hypothetical protein NGR52_004244 [Vibrio parahaemolyticus]|nr:hypothetical protein [Vibrio parahaemolyticus]
MHFSLESLLKDFAIAPEAITPVSIKETDFPFRENTLGECYFNSAMAVAQSHGEFEYALGIARDKHGIFYCHAFVYDTENECYYDPTWGVDKSNSYWVFKVWNYLELQAHIQKFEQAPMLQHF